MVAVFPRGVGRRPHLLSSFLLLLSLCFTAPAWVNASEPAAGTNDGQRFLAVSLNEVSGNPPDHNRLAAFFEWLSADGWTAVSLDDIELARRGEKPLPEKAILLTFDNGYRDLYQRVYPLARQHGMSVVASLSSDRLDAGDERYIDWEQAREMQASGRVEFAVAPPAPADLLSGGNDAAFRTRLHDVLQQARERLHRELGQTPRALACPYGRCSRMAQGLASELGFGFALGLQPEMGDVTRPMAIGRYLPLLGDPLRG